MSTLNIDFLLFYALIKLTGLFALKITFQCKQFFNVENVQKNTNALTLICVIVQFKLIGNAKI